MEMTAKIVGTKLVIEIETQTPTPSATGKTLVIASTRGNMKTDVMVNGKPVTIGLNAYISAK
jgi:hypothetical protein